LIELDVIAKRYGVLPSSLLHSENTDFQFDMLVASKAIEEEIKQAKRANQRKSRRPGGR